jgi:hypothetical protein
VRVLFHAPWQSLTKDGARAIGIFIKEFAGFGVKVARATPRSVDREGAADKNYELSVSVVGIPGNEQPFVSP